MSDNTDFDRLAWTGDEVTWFQQRIDELEAENEQLRHANDLLEKSGKHYLSQMQKFEADAERYRFLRDNKHEVRMWSPDGESNRVRAWLSGKRLDAAIDAAREDT